MTPVIIDSRCCAYDNCTLPVEVYEVRFFHSEPGPHTCVEFFRCVAGHRWQETNTAVEVTE